MTSSLLSIVGRSQVGRIRYTGDKEQLNEEVPVSVRRRDSRIEARRQPKRDRSTLVLAESATQAKAISDAFEGSIDLLITNHMLRDGLGREIADYITKRRPSMKVLQISGHSYQELKSEGHLLPDAAFLAKPFGRHEINAKVTEVLRA